MPETKGYDYDQSWIQFSDFIDGFTAFLAKKQSSTVLFTELEAILEADGDSVSRLNSAISFLKQRDFSNLMGEFFAEAFPDNVYRKYFAKDSEMGAKMYSLGKRHLMEKRYREAVGHFSSSIRATPGHDYENLARAFNKRSLVFFREKQYYDSILDSQEALRLQPNSSTSELYLRIAKAALLNEFEEEKQFTDTMECLLQASLPEEEAQKLSDLIKLIQEKRASTSVEDEMDVDEIDLQLKAENLSLKGASVKVGVSLIEGKNRAIVAKEEIEAEEALFREKPYSVHFLEHTLEYNCANCLNNLGQDPTEPESNSFVACENCNKFIFCNRQCRAEAMDRYHRMECKRMVFVVENEIGIAYLVLRTLLRKGIHNAIENDLKEDYYNQVWGLMPHDEDHDSKSNICFLIAAYFLEHCIKHFELCVEEFSHQTMIHLLIHHLRQLSSNVLLILNQDLISGKEDPIAVGIYPSISMLNHSCEPDLQPIFFGSQLVLRSLRPIKSGEEICFCYGPTYLNTTFAKRQQRLKSQYFFNCNCRACTNRFECFDETYLCQECYSALFLQDENVPHFVCKNGHKATDVQALLACVKEVQQFLDSGRHFMELGEKKNEDADLIAALVTLAKADVIVTKKLYVLNPLWIEVKTDMASCYIKMGHYDRAAIYSEQIIKAYQRFPVQFKLRLALQQIRYSRIASFYLEELDPVSQRTEFIELTHKVINNLRQTLEAQDFLSVEDFQYATHTIRALEANLR